MANIIPFPHKEPSETMPFRDMSNHSDEQIRKIYRALQPIYSNFQAYLHETIKTQEIGVQQDGILTLLQFRSLYNLFQSLENQEKTA